MKHGAWKIHLLVWILGFGVFCQPTVGFGKHGAESWQANLFVAQLQIGQPESPPTFAGTQGTGASCAMPNGGYKLGRHWETNYNFREKKMGEYSYVYVTGGSRSTDWYPGADENGRCITLSNPDNVWSPIEGDYDDLNNLGEFREVASFPLKVYTLDELFQNPEILQELNKEDGPRSRTNTGGGSWTRCREGEFFVGDYTYRKVTTTFRLLKPPRGRKSDKRSALFSLPDLKAGYENGTLSGSLQVVVNSIQVLRDSYEECDCCIWQ